jgi:hypothetical protein
MRFLFHFFLYLSLVFPLFSQAGKDLDKFNFAKSVSKKVRTHIGIPGKQYWQNKSVYDLKCKFDPSLSFLEGNGEIIYFNKSKKNISEIYIHLAQNAYREDSIRARYISPENTTKGLQIISLYIDDLPLEDKQLQIQGTIGKIVLLKPLKPLNRVVLKIRWQYNLSIAKYENAFDGKFSAGSFFLSNWYPRISVYDDLVGWDKANYDFLHKEYSDFSNYYIQISVPANYTIWGNGILENPEILGESVQQNIEKASQKPVIIQKPKSETKSSDTWHSWKWKSESVKDFSFVASSTLGWKEFVIQNYQFTLLYQKNSLNFQKIPDFMTSLIPLHVKFFGELSKKERVIIFDGSGEIQFPGFINVKGESSVNKLFRKLTYQFIRLSLFDKLGWNTNKYLWVNNGISTALENLYSSQLFAEQFTISTPIDHYTLSQKNILTKPIATDTIKLGEEEFENISQGKSGIAFASLITILGPEKFAKDWKSFSLQWEGKHPTIYDLQNYFQKIGKNSLDWFWKSAFYANNYPDLKILGVTKKQNKSILKIQNIGGMPVPIHLRIYYSGDEKIIKKPASVWKPKNVWELELEGQPERIILGEEEIPDSNSQDNYWQP